MPGGFSKRTLTVIVVALVVLASVGVLLVFFSVDEGQVLSVDLTPPSPSAGVLTFAFTIHTEHAFASGSGTFTAALNGTVTDSREVSIDAGGGRVDEAFSRFAVANGVYTFHLEYKGVRGTATYELGVPDHTNFIVTSVSAETRNAWVGDDNRTGAIRFSAYFYSDEAAGYQTAAPPGTSLTMQLNKNGFPDGPPVTNGTEGKTFLSRTFTVSLGPGNYSVNWTFANAWVKDSSPIAAFTGGNTTFVHNKPKACVQGAPYRGTSAQNFTITADGSCSTDDIAIVQHSWDFGDGSQNVSSDPSALESHHYPAAPPTRNYTGTLIVTDNLGEIDIASFAVSISYA